jgi:hypothetical protein
VAAPTAEVEEGERKARDDDVETRVRNMTLADQVRHLADRNKAEGSRHLLQDEYEILIQAATAIERTH